MTEAEIERTKIGDRVMYKPLSCDHDEYCEGTIVHKLGRKIEVAWDDGTIMHYAADPTSRIFPLNK